MADGAPPLDDSPAQQGGSPKLENELPPRPSSPPEKTASPGPAPPVNPEEMAQLERVLQSDIGVSILLTRLKQTIASTRDFSSFLRKRSVVEEEHAQGLKKLARAVHDSAHRIDNRQGTFSSSCEEINRIHDRMADHGLQFALSLQQMSDDLNELAANMERGRKQWKQNGLNAEKRVQEAESMAEKAKAKYNSLAEQYDRARTGDIQPGKFGLKGPKSAAQHEQDLLRKVQNSDTEYASKVQTAQSQKHELISSLRPQAVRALQDLIAEGDSGLSLQMQKFATFTEKLLLGKGLCVSPFKDNPNANAPAFKSLRDVASQVDNEKDFKTYVLGHASKVASGSTEVKYEKHPVHTCGRSPAADPCTNDYPTGYCTTPPCSVAVFRTYLQFYTSTICDHSRPAPARSAHFPTTAAATLSGAISTAISAPYQHPPQQESFGVQHQSPIQPTPQHQYPPPGPAAHMPSPYQPYSPIKQQSSLESQLIAKNGHGANLPPLKPVFGVSLEDLFQRDGTAIPMIVYQCIQGIELFGLNVEGIYRLSGNANHIAHLKALFDNDSSQVDFTNPENFFHDVNSVAGLLKQFFRELPDPLFTNKYYADFINAARRDDDIQRRDALHALINNLPDPNYATLRALVLHLNHVHERSAENRMNAGNIAISFGLTLMGANAGHNIADSGWQARVIETILQNTFQIFDED
ncbi:hypothetical protein ACJ72_02614 [Emergomyces africanus]|uniref:Rho-GAP domain-containing protein n=1 Tax=Emergomyces africanus TaxID=1955775 RepID=A0A1B7P1X3_9EURO|nr:hypothetical protein ACJ72_02614 [Emergomyces africanus]